MSLLHTVLDREIQKISDSKGDEQSQQGYFEIKCFPNREEGIGVCVPNRLSYVGTSENSYNPSRTVQPSLS